MSDKISLGWMDKIREMEDLGMRAPQILNSLKRYGESEEERITKELQEGTKWKR